MPTTIDELQVEISSSANDVDKQIDSLVKTLDKLQKTLSGTGGGAYKKYTSGTKTATNETKKLSSEVKKVNNNFKQTEKTTDSLARSFGKFYANYFLLIRALKGTWDSVESTADYVESFNYFTVSMGKIASRWDDQWTNYADENARNYSNRFYTTLDNTFKKLSGVSYSPDSGLLSETGLKNLGLNLQEITQYAAQLGSMMDAVGQSGETTLATTNAFVKLAGDISSLYNIDYAKAAEKIRSVLQGQSRAGYGFGWDTTMASLQATADKLDLSKPVSEMSQMEKQQLRILTILEQSRVAWGDQANTINTVANQLRIFKNNLSEIGMVFGQLFIPMLQRVIPYINGFSIAIKRLLSDLAGLLGIKIEDVGQGFGDMGEDMEDAADGFDDLAESAKKAKAGLRGFDELKTISLSDTDKMSDSLGNQIDISDEIAEATKEYEEYWQNAMNDMKNRAEELATTISNAFDFEDIAKNVSDLFKAIQDFNDEIEPFTDGFGEGFLAFFETLGGVTFTAFTKGLELLADALGLVPEDLLESVGNGLGVLTGAVVTLVAVQKVGTSFANLSTGLATLAKTLATHPILATFALAAGIVALFELRDKKIHLEVYSEMGGLLEDWDKLQQDITETTSKLDGLNIKFQDLDSQELKNVYKRWKKLNEKVGELTDEEKGLIKAYSDTIIDLFPKAEGYIDDNGKAYGRLADELDNAINKAVLLSAVEAADELRMEAVKITVEAEIELDEAEKAVQEAFDYIKQQFPELTEKELQSALDYYGKTGIMAVPGTDMLTPLELAAQRNPERYGELDWLTGTYKDFEKLRTEADEYLKNVATRDQAQQNLATSEERLNAIIDKSIELGYEYSKMLDETENKVNELSLVLRKTAKNSFGKIIEQIQEFTSESGKAVTAVEKLMNSLNSINGKEVNVAVKLNTEGEIVEIKRPGLVITPYATGGFPEDGLFMANHNELVGKFSNGKTAVANNQQITQGITDAVYPAVYNAVTAAFSNKGTEPIRVFVGDRELTDIVVDGINQRTRAGKQPLYGW